MVQYFRSCFRWADSRTNNVKRSGLISGWLKWFHWRHYVFIDSNKTEGPRNWSTKSAFPGNLITTKSSLTINKAGNKAKQLFDTDVTNLSVCQIDYPEIAEGIGPRHRFMSAYEQRIEPPDRRWQYLLLAAEPYETIAFKVLFLSVILINRGFFFNAQNA